ncbi:MAG: hypothetical protein KGL35_08015, partial [Bradyrhizobium sp.]|nr:hypothetical protein [Bradyrhizobium sp.]
MSTEQVNAPTGEEVRELLAMLERPEDALDIGAYYARVFAALCHHFLASQQPMTAGEFAGLVIASIERERNDRQQEVMKLPADSLGCNYA